MLNRFLNASWDLFFILEKEGMLFSFQYLLMNQPRFLLFITFTD